MGKILNFFRNKKVLVTGHTGFKGAWLSHVLLNSGAKVVGVSLDPPTKPNLFETLNLEDHLAHYKADIRDLDKLQEIFSKEKPEVIFHFAAQALVREGYRDPHFTFSTNVLGTVNVLEAVRIVGGARAVVVATTDKVYKNIGMAQPYKEEDVLGGKDPYSASKAAADISTQSFIKSFFPTEDLGRTHKTGVAIVRAGNIIGGGDWGKDRLLPDIVRSVYEKRGKNLIIRNPKSVRPWQHVLDPIHGCLLLAKELSIGNKNAVGAWNFGPKEINFITVEEMVKRSLSRLEKGEYEIAPDSEKPEEAILTLDASRANNHLGWQPRYHIDEALDRTIEWYKCFYERKPVIQITDEQISSYFNEV